jgi:arylsulfatase A-like enzyme
MKPKNIILIVIDAVRSNNLGCYGYHQKTSPFIDSLAKQGTIFENAFSCINTTDPSITSIFTGLLPINHGIRHHGAKVKQNEITNFYEKDIKTLTYFLNKAGYTSFGLDWLSRWHKEYFDFYLGIGKEAQKSLYSKIFHILKKPLRYLYKFKLIRNIKDKSCREHRDKRAFEKAKEIIKEKDNYFLFIHFWGTHIPYIYETRTMKLFFNDLKSSKQIKKNDLKNIAKYNASIRKIDEQLKELFKTLKEKDDTLIIITSDHGESLVEHGIKFDHHGLYDVSVKVPLILYWPKYFKKNKRINGLVQHTDLIPTLLEIFKINHSEKFDGKSLTSLITGNKKEIRDHIFLEENYYQKKKAIRTKRYKFIKDFNNGKKCSMCQVIHGEDLEFYDLQKDKLENKNIAKENSEKVKEFKEILKKYKTPDIKSKKTEEIPSYNKEEEEVKQKLKELGYLD